MIASHDTYTYLSPRNPVMNLISMWWRCQKIDIYKQYDLGVRLFDVRLYRYKNAWYTSHGMAKFDEVSFENILYLCKYFETRFPDSFLRIVLEDNVKNCKNSDIKELFLKEAKEAYETYKSMIWCICTHHPWETYYYNQDFSKFKIKDYYCKLFNWDTDKSFLENIKQFEITSWSLPAYAKKHNPEITREMIDDPNTMHVLDYIGVYPKK